MASDSDLWAAQVAIRQARSELIPLLQTPAKPAAVRALTALTEAREAIDRAWDR